jgi:hypothetical protein
MKMFRHNAFWILILVLIDLLWAFIQYYSYPIDGDLYAIVLPAPWYADVLNDPFGFSLLSEEHAYGGAGRYVAHALMATYFQWMPLYLQVFVEPVTSIYLSMALFKLALHFGFLITLSAYLNGHWNFKKVSFWSSYLCFVPLLQTEGLYGIMGIIDHATTYTFFYALPILCMLWLWYPVYHWLQYGQGKPFLTGIRWVSFLIVAFLLSFFGPMSQSILVLVAGTLLLYWGAQLLIDHPKKHRPAHKSRYSFLRYPLTLVLVMVCAFYGYWTGTYNSENQDALPLMELLPFLQKGLLKYFFQSEFFYLGSSILLLLWFFLKQDEDRSIRNWRKLIIWGALMILLYLILVPMGGYRSYRPLIYRNDLLIPFTLFVYFMVVKGIQLALQQMNTSHRRLGTVIAVGLGVVLFTVDLRVRRDGHACERRQLISLQQSSAPKVILSSDCPVMGWEMDQSTYYSDFKVDLLQHWGVLHREVQFIHE